MDAHIERLSTADLMKRYNLKSRATLALRMDAAKVESYKEGKSFYVSVKDVERLDRLNECMKQGKRVSECLGEIDGKVFDPVKLASPTIQALALNTTIEQVNDLLKTFAYLIEQREALTIDPWLNYRSLNEFASEGWHIPTSKLLPLLELKSIPKLDKHNTFSRMGFTFWRSRGKIGRQYEWKVTKD